MKEAMVDLLARSDPWVHIDGLKRLFLRGTNRIGRPEIQDYVPGCFAVQEWVMSRLAIPFFVDNLRSSFTTHHSPCALDILLPLAWP